MFLTSDLSFVQNLPEGDKMELDSYLAHNMFKAASIFSLVSDPMDVDKRYKVTSNSIQEKTLHVEEHQKAFLQKTNVNAKALKALLDEVADLKQVQCDSLQQTMKVVLGVCDRVMEQTRKLCSDVKISAKALDVFKSALGVAL